MKLRSILPFAKPKPIIVPASLIARKRLSGSATSPERPPKFSLSLRNSHAPRNASPPTTVRFGLLLSSKSGCSAISWLRFFWTIRAPPTARAASAPTTKTLPRRPAIPTEYPFI
jgi:hypothetical protein